MEPLVQTPLPVLDFVSHPSLSLLSGGISLLSWIQTLALTPPSFVLALAHPFGRQGLGCSFADPWFSQFPAWQVLTYLSLGVSPISLSADGVDEGPPWMCSFWNET